MWQVLSIRNNKPLQGFEWSHRSILCPAKNCNFINNCEIGIIHSINCPFHLLYCEICKSLYNVSVLTHDCNVIKSQRSIHYFFKYYHENPPANHSHKDIFLLNNSCTETFEDRGKIIFDMFMCVALSHFPPTSVLTKRILQRQNGVIELSSTTTYNTDRYYFCFFYLFTTRFVKFLHLISVCFIYSCILLCKYYLKLLNLFNLIINLLNHKQVN